MPGTGLKLDLVYNPGGAFLAPPQVRSNSNSNLHSDVPDHRWFETWLPSWWHTLSCTPLAPFRVHIDSKLSKFKIHCVQAKLQEAYKAELRAYGVEFSDLLAINNMPIKRFADWLQVGS